MVLAGGDCSCGGRVGAFGVCEVDGRAREVDVVRFGDGVVEVGVGRI